MGLSALDPGKELGEFPILLIALVRIPGEHTEQSQKHGNVGKEGENAESGDTADQIQYHCKNTKKPRKRVNAVATCHKAADGVTKALKHKWITSY